MRRLFRLFGVLFLAVVLMAAYGFFRDDAEVEVAAVTAACGARPKCTARLARLEKTPLWRDLHLRVSGGETVVVRCTREMWVTGKHQCLVR